MPEERALIFDCAGEVLVGVLAEPAQAASLGVLIVVGGPQYRVGSHRQFVLLARRLAQAGIAAMRFDSRGMGDSSGDMQGFEDLAPDIDAAIEAFKEACPSLEQLVLWGLCDAASAALLYWHATADSRIAGMVLVNPWVRSEESLAKARLEHYYGHRLLERGFWTKLARGEVRIGAAVGAFVRAMMAAARGGDKSIAAGSAFQDRMAAGLSTFARPVLLLLSGRDLTAQEFVGHCKSPRWSGLVQRSNVERREVPQADHTFSSAVWRADVETLTLDWLARSFSVHPQ